MEKKWLMSYDSQGDVLYIYLEDQRVGAYEELEQGVFLRRHNETREVIGLMVIDFAKQFQTDSRHSIPLYLLSTAWSDVSEDKMKP